MTEQKSLLAVFHDLEPAADAVEQLRRLGIHDDHMSVISGVPVTEPMLGRPHQWTNVPRIAMGGAAIGMAVGIALSFWAPNMYAIRVGGQPFAPVPPAIIVIFEMTMLGMLLSTFLGVFLDSFFPNYRPLHYVPEISDGKFAILVECSSMDETKITDMMKKMGAESVQDAEAQHL
ncbi:MAG: hypothetical protein HFACDABA_02167 [Anaerolineales bacterium]|nr:hypothetical protein [Anaerolineales bacterium]